MLVLSRKADQGIVILGNIRVRVLSVRGNRVRLGIEAPREVSVTRDELREYIPAENPVETSATESVNDFAMAGI